MNGVDWQLVSLLGQPAVDLDLIVSKALGKGLFTWPVACPLGAYTLFQNQPLLIPPTSEPWHHTHCFCFHQWGAISVSASSSEKLPLFFISSNEKLSLSFNFIQWEAASIFHFIQWEAASIFLFIQWKAASIFHFNQWEATFVFISSNEKAPALIFRTVLWYPGFWWAGGRAGPRLLHLVLPAGSGGGAEARPRTHPPWPGTLPAISFQVFR